MLFQLISNTHATLIMTISKHLPLVPSLMLTKGPRSQAPRHSCPCITCVWRLQIKPDDLYRWPNPNAALSDCMRIRNDLSTLFTAGTRSRGPERGGKMQSNSLTPRATYLQPTPASRGMEAESALGTRFTDDFQLQAYAHLRVLSEISNPDK